MRTESGYMGADRLVWGWQEWCRGLAQRHGLNQQRVDSNDSFAVPALPSEGTECQPARALLAYMVSITRQPQRLTPLLVPVPFVPVV